MITITSKKAGFRRCGIAHSDLATSYEDDAFTPEQLEILQAEPMLTVAVEVEKKLTKAEEKAAKAEAEARAKAEADEAEAKAKAKAEAAEAAAKAKSAEENKS